MVKPMDISTEDIRALIRDKYEGDETANIEEDLERLQNEEPLAYVIGWIPFLGLRIDLSSRPLIPRPETEWWTEKLCAHLRAKFADAPFTFLDLCSGSGAIGLAIAKQFPNAHVTLSDVDASHKASIEHSIELNGLSNEAITLGSGDLFQNLQEARFNVIAANPPYIPDTRALPRSVTAFEPSLALYSGSDGLELIERITKEVSDHLHAHGELWLECDIAHSKEVAELLSATGADSTIHEDQYGRPRFVVSYYP